MSTKSKFAVIAMTIFTAISFNANAWIYSQEQVDHIAKMPALDASQLSDEDLTDSLHQANAYYLDLLNKKYKLQNTFKALDVLQRDISAMTKEMMERGIKK